MPIHGLTDGQGFLPQIATIRKGAEQGKNRPGSDLEYFRFSSPNEPELEDKFHHIFGQEPKTIPCMMPYPDAVHIFDAWNYHFGKSGVKIKCDGQNIWSEQQDDGNMTYYSQELGPPCRSSDVEGCAGIDPKTKKPILCTPRGRLFIIIPALERYGTVAVMTGSRIDIRNIAGTLNHLEEMAHRYGIDLTQIPMQLVRHKEKQSSPTAGGKRIMVIRSMLRLEPLPSWITSRMIARTNDGQYISVGNESEDLRQALPAANPQAESNQAVKGELLPPPAPDIPAPADPTPDRIPEIKDLLNRCQIPEEKQAAMVCLIINRRITSDTLAEMNSAEVDQTIQGIQLMQSTIAKIEDNMRFLEEMLLHFKTGHFTAENWNFTEQLESWSKQQVPPPPDDLPF